MEFVTCRIEIPDSLENLSTLHMPSYSVILTFLLLAFEFATSESIVCPLFKAHNKFQLCQKVFLFFLVFLKLLCTHNLHLLFSFLMPQRVDCILCNIFVSPMFIVSSLRLGAMSNYLLSMNRDWKWSLPMVAYEWQ